MTTKKTTKANRTTINDLPADAQALAKQTAQRVRGGIAVSDPGPDDPPYKPPTKPKGTK
ncbi:MAG: hypothetical protein U0Y68_03325 [Blastocatellia bacterium]|mgnify:CR=1 FL=1